MTGLCAVARQPGTATYKNTTGYKCYADTTTADDGREISGVAIFPFQVLCLLWRADFSSGLDSMPHSGSLTTAVWDQYLTSKQDGRKRPVCH